MKRVHQRSAAAVVRCVLVALLVCGVWHGTPAAPAAAADQGENKPAPAAESTEAQQTAQKAEAERIQALRELREAEEKATWEQVRKDPQWRPSHEEQAILKIGPEPTRGALHNFCLNLDGNLLVCCGGTRKELPPGTLPPGSNPYLARDLALAKTVVEPGEIRVLSPDGRLLETWGLDFKPQAICVHRDGTIFVGGDGHLAKLNPQGKVLLTTPSPNLDQTVAPSPETQQTNPGSPPPASSGAPAGQDSEVTQKRANAMLEFGRAITGIAVSDSDVFVAGGMSKGFTYAVWRTDHQFGHRQRIIKGLRGCCTLLDIQVKDGELWVAENARHRVIRYDRDGKELASFGKKDRTSGDGFGGCCEPKNLRFGPDGDLYCSQSESPSVVKRFTPQGEFRGVVTLADFQCGCARVTVEISKDGRDVYVLDPATDTIHKFVAKEPGPAPK